MAPALADHVSYWLDKEVYGGIVAERLLAALPLADGLWCGLVLSFPTAGKPTLEWWERLDDLERQGFVPIGAARARAICDALPRFLERLEQVSGRQQSEALVARLNELADEYDADDALSASAHLRAAATLVRERAAPPPETMAR